ncbi:MAG TPA: glycosyltransferase family 39 protein [Drouetiella sp.]
MERDESQCLGLVNDPNLFHWVQTLILNDANTPLFHLCAYPLVVLTGENVFVLKIFGLLIATALPAVAYKLFRKTLGEPGTLLFCLLLAISPILIRDGELIRPYGMLQIGVLVATKMLFDFLADSKKPFWKYSLLMAAGLYLHLSSLALWAGHSLAALVAVVRRWISIPKFIEWIKAMVLALIIFSPWLCIVVWQLGQHMHPWQRRVPIFSLITLNVHNMFFDSFHVLDSFIALVVAWGMCIYGAGLKKTGLNSAGWLFVLVGSVAGSVILHQFGAPYRDRYLSIFDPIALFCLAQGCTRAYDAAINRQGLKRNLLFFIAVLPAILLVVNWVWELKLLFRIPESATADAYYICAGHIDKKKDLVVVALQVFGTEAYRIVPRDAKILSFPDSNELRYIQWRGLSQRAQNDSAVANLISEMDKTLKQGGTVWFIDAVHDERFKSVPEDFQDLQFYRAQQMRDWLTQNASLALDQKFLGREGDCRLLKFEPAKP